MSPWYNKLCCTTSRSFDIACSYLHCNTLCYIIMYLFRYSVVWHTLGTQDIFNLYPCILTLSAFCSASFSSFDILPLLSCFLVCYKAFFVVNPFPAILAVALQADATHETELNYDVLTFLGLLKLSGLLHLVGSFWLLLGFLTLLGILDLVFLGLFSVRTLLDKLATDATLFNPLYLSIIGPLKPHHNSKNLQICDLCEGWTPRLVFFSFFNRWK